MYQHVITWILLFLMPFAKAFAISNEITGISMLTSKPEIKCVESQERMSHVVGCYDGQLVTGLWGKGLFQYHFDRKEWSALLQSNKFVDETFQSLIISPKGEYAFWTDFFPKNEFEQQTRINYKLGPTEKWFTMEGRILTTGDQVLSLSSEMSSDGESVIQEVLNVVGQDPSYLQKSKITSGKKNSVKGPSFDRLIGISSISSNGDRIYFYHKNAVYLYDSTKGSNELSSGEVIYSIPKERTLERIILSRDLNKMVLLYKEGHSILEKDPIDEKFKEKGFYDIAVKEKWPIKTWKPQFMDLFNPTFLKAQFLSPEVLIDYKASRDDFGEIVLKSTNHVTNNVPNKFIRIQIPGPGKNYNGMDYKDKDMQIVTCNAFTFLVKALDKVCRIQFEVLSK